MSSESAAVAVRPNASLLKAIGVLNVLFGSVLFLLGLVFLRAVTDVARMQILPLQADDAQLFYDEVRKYFITRIELAEKATSDASVKAALVRERVALKGSSRKFVDQVDLKTLNEHLRWLEGYLWVNVITAPVLSLLMLASGIGLTQLRCWARTLGIWVAALKIVRIVLLELFFLIAVVPHLARASEQLMATDAGKALTAMAVAEQTTKPGAAAAAPSFQAGANTVTVFWIAFAVIYPAISLLVLTRPATRAACQDAEEEEDVDNAE